MHIWLNSLSFLINFTFGVLLVILPSVNEASAGIAYGMFFLAKMLFLIPAGCLGDRIGHSRGILMAILLQIGGLLTIDLLPHWVWVGRLLEGMALAQGTVSVISLYRLETSVFGDFSSRITKLLTFSSAGFLLGPPFGYAISSFGPSFILRMLATVYLLTIPIHFLSTPLLKKMPENQIHDFSFEPNSLEPLVEIKHKLPWVVTLAAVKGLALGWLPLITWWTKQKMEYGTLWAGAGFIVLGLAFMCGTRLKASWLILIGPLSFGLLEFASPENTWAWWTGLLMLGTWYGSGIATSTSQLGWSDTEKLGQYNSFWMLMTETLAAIVPMVIWKWRYETSAINGRVWVMLCLLILGLTGPLSKNLVAKRISTQ